MAEMPSRVSVNGHDRAAYTIDGRDVLIGWDRDEATACYVLNVQSMAGSIHWGGRLRTVSDYTIAQSTIGPQRDALFFFGSVTRLEVCTALGWPPSPAPRETPASVEDRVPRIVYGEWGGGVGWVGVDTDEDDYQPPRRRNRPAPPAIIERKRRTILPED